MEKGMNDSNKYISVDMGKITQEAAISLDASNAKLVTMLDGLLLSEDVLDNLKVAIFNVVTDAQTLSVRKFGKGIADRKRKAGLI